MGQSEKQSIRSSVRVGNIQLLRSPKLRTEAIIMIECGGGYSRFCEHYGDYYLAGYRIGGETGILISTTSFSSRTDETYGITATLEVLFFDKNKTWIKDLHEYDSGQSVKLLGYDTLQGQNWNISSAGDGVQVFKEQTLHVLGRSQSILDRVVAAMDENGASGQTSLTDEQCDRLAEAGLVVELMLSPISSLREVRRRML
jgi:hypothetical protein